MMLVNARIWIQAARLFQQNSFYHSRLLLGIKLKRKKKKRPQNGLSQNNSFITGRFDKVILYFDLIYNLPCLFLFFFFLSISNFCKVLDGSHADISVFIMYFECLLWVTHLMTVKKREQEWIQPRDHWILFYCHWTLSIRVNPMNLAPFWASRKLLK